MMKYRWRSLSFFAALLLPLLCQAQADSMSATDEMAFSTDTVAQQKKETPKAINYVALPIPLSNPALGTGLTVVGMALYNPNESDRAWVTGVAGMKAGDSSAFGVVQQAYLMENKLRLLAVVGRADLDLKFYGVGSDAGSRNVYLPIEQQGTGGLLQALYHVGDRWFLGLRYQNMRIKSTVDLSQLPVIGTEVQAFELNHRTASLGPAVEFDTRDDSFYPTLGTYAKGNLNFASPTVGSDVSFRQLQVSWNRYWQYATNTVLAARVSGCGVSGQVPFTSLCMYGSSNDLRGYSTGQYRDRAMLAAQAEMRWKFEHRWGAAAFGGFGGVAPTFSDLLKEKILPSVGVGLRWQASQDYKVNVSADIAFTKDDHAFYLYIGEAF
jgi:hypothetical protein